MRLSLTQRAQRMLTSDVAWDRPVHGADGASVTLKCTPGLRRRFSPNRHVPRHRGFCDLQAEHEQLTVNARRSPRRVLAGDSALGSISRSRPGRIASEALGSASLTPSAETLTIVRSTEF